LNNGSVVWRPAVVEEMTPILMMFGLLLENVGNTVNTDKTNRIVNNIRIFFFMVLQASLSQVFIFADRKVDTTIEGLILPKKGAFIWVLAILHFLCFQLFYVSSVV
jgi:hypothetical protein